MEYFASALLNNLTYFLMEEFSNIWQNLPDTILDL